VSGVTVTPKRFEERGYTAAPDEGHNHIDSVRGFDLRAQLAPQAWLARRVSEQGRIEQGNQRLADDIGTSVRPVPQYRMQHGGRIDRDSPRVYCDQFAKTIKQGAGNDQSDPNPVLLTDISQRPLDLTAQMPGDPIGRLRGAKSPMLGREPVGEGIKARPQPRGDQRLI